MYPHTYPGQWCLHRLPEEDLCRAGTHSGPHPRVTHWTETPAARCRRNSPAGTGCPSELWGYMWDRAGKDTECRDTSRRHGWGCVGKWRGVRMRDGMEEDKGDARRKRDSRREQRAESFALVWAFSLIERKEKVDLEMIHLGWLIKQLCSPQRAHADGKVRRVLRRTPRKLGTLNMDWLVMDGWRLQTHVSQEKED